MDHGCCSWSDRSPSRLGWVPRMVGEVGRRRWPKEKLERGVYGMKGTGMYGEKDRTPNTPKAVRIAEQWHLVHSGAESHISGSTILQPERCMVKRKFRDSVEILHFV